MNLEVFLIQNSPFTIFQESIYPLRQTFSLRSYLITLPVESISVHFSLIPATNDSKQLYWVLIMLMATLASLLKTNQLNPMTIKGPEVQVLSIFLVYFLAQQPNSWLSKYLQMKKGVVFLNKMPLEEVINKLNFSKACNRNKNILKNFIFFLLEQ